MNKDLIVLFREESIKRGLALENSNSKKANEAYDKIHKTYLLLKDMDKLDELKPLLDDESPYVRLWAAGYLLKTYPKKAEQVLVELGKVKGISVAFDARITLFEWKEGNLKF